MYRMSAASPEEKEEWMKNIKSVYSQCDIVCLSIAYYTNANLCVMFVVYILVIRVTLFSAVLLDCTCL